MILNFLQCRKIFHWNIVELRRIFRNGILQNTPKSLDPEINKMSLCSIKKLENFAEQIHSELI